jgi:hypothetical protein
MGFESFQVELRGGQLKHRDVNQIIRQLPHIVSDHDSMPMQGSTYYLLNDGQHIIEVEIKDAPVKLSCRFTLCHLPSVDRVFLGLVRELMVRLGMEATVCDALRPEDARSFALHEFSQFSAITSNCIAARRAEWIAAFGDSPMAATTNEVYQRVILPQCQPGIEQPT